MYKYEYTHTHKLSLYLSLSLTHTLLGTVYLCMHVSIYLPAVTSGESDFGTQVPQPLRRHFALESSLTRREQKLVDIAHSM
jgi:hypothetical protein